MKIKILEKQDIELLNACFERDFQAYFDQQQNQDRVCFVALIDNCFVGHISVMDYGIFGPYAYQGIPEILDLQVLDAYQGQKIGDALLKKAISYAASLKQDIIIGVLYSNIKALNLYLKNDFVITNTGAWIDNKVASKEMINKYPNNLVLYMKKDYKPNSL